LLQVEVLEQLPKLEAAAGAGEFMLQIQFKFTVRHHIRHLLEPEAQEVALLLVVMETYRRVLIMKLPVAVEEKVGVTVSI
jgi:hypothetical protein